LRNSIRPRFATGGVVEDRALIRRGGEAQIMQPVVRRQLQTIGPDGEGNG